MKKIQNNSTRASALQITLSVALLAVSAILFASSFKAAPPSSTAQANATGQQDGFYPPLPRADAPQGGNPAITVQLPIDTMDTSVPANTILIKPMNTTLIDPTTTMGINYVGFQGDFTFDSAVMGFATPQVQGSGLTGSNWNVSSNILNTGPGTIKTLRISAFSLDFTPLNGMGTLFNFRMLRVSNTPGDMTPLTWKPAPDNFFFIDEDLGSHSPNQPPGLITITGAQPTPSATPTATATATVVPSPTATSTATATATASSTATATATATSTATATATATAIVPTPSPSATATSTATATATATATSTATATATAAATATATATVAPTQTPQPSVTPGGTPHGSPTPRPHVTPTPRPPHVTPTPSPHVTPTPRPPHVTPTPMARGAN